MKMKLFRLKVVVMAFAALAAWTLPVQASKIRVVTTLTDLADLAREVGKDHVDVHSLATGVEDTHGVPMKPSFVPLLNRADLLICVGFDCEHAFLPALLEASKNPGIQIGHSGYVDCGKGIIPIGVPKSTDHSEGDVHPYGNPHYMLDPEMAKIAVKEICDALIAFAPQYQSDFAKNRDSYLAELDSNIAKWKSLAENLKGVKFISYHEEWEYFAKEFNMVVFGTVELKPGIDPTPRHIEELIAAMKSEHVPIVIREPQFPEKVPKLIAEKTGATLVTLPIMPGGVPNTDTYIAMIDYLVTTLASAVKGK